MGDLIRESIENIVFLTQAENTFIAATHCSLLMVTNYNRIGFKFALLLLAKQRQAKYG